jgi:excinuclease ABC subunit B
VGINLLREGLDLPEVALVAILDADKEGFLRSETSLIQTIGRAARNVRGKVILYAGELTDSIRQALAETERRRRLQLEYNEKHGITPETIRKAVKDIVQGLRAEEEPLAQARARVRARAERLTPHEVTELIAELEQEMFEAAKRLEFERAAALRDEIKELRKELIGLA